MKNCFHAPSVAAKRRYHTVTGYGLLNVKGVGRAWEEIEKWYLPRGEFFILQLKRVV